MKSKTNTGSIPANVGHSVTNVGFPAYNWGSKKKVKTVKITRSKIAA